MPAKGASLPGGSGELVEEKKVCASWPVHQLSREFLRAPQAKTSILAVTADFDIEAPASIVRSALAGFPHAQVVVFPGRARATDLDWGDCMGPLVTAFLQTRRQGQLDTGCVKRLKRPAFAVSGAS
jgi:hypothetical protein